MSHQPVLDLFAPDVRPVSESPVKPQARRTRELGHRRADLSRKGLWLRLLGTYQIHGPLTDAEMAQKLGIDRTTVNARRNELVKIGKVKDTGETRKNLRSGIQNTLWGLV